MANKRKRKGQTNESTSVVSLNNQFDLLSDDENEPSSGNVAPKKSALSPKRERVPPVVVTVSDFHSFRKELLNFISEVKLSFQIGRRGECRVLAESLAGHELLLKYLTGKQYKFFTYDTKTERLFKVVCKGLPSGESPDQIKIELTNLLGFAPVQVIKMKMKSRPGNARNGISQEFYLVHFKTSELNNIKALEKASLMLQVRVKWEHFRKTGKSSQNLTQCRKCQGWGHGTRNCQMDTKCMLCGDSSHVKDICPVKDDPKKFKCANCGECHKSNFWECKTRKRILDSRVKKQVGNVQRSLPVGNSSFVPTVNNGQQRTASSFVPTGSNSHLGNKSTYAAVAAGRNTNYIQHLQTEDSVPKSNDSDLGSITAPKLEFLQHSLTDMIKEMLNATSMIEAIQTGVKFANKIVMTLKFSNGF